MNQSNDVCETKSIDLFPVKEFLKKYKPGEWIYPAVIQRNLKLYAKDAYAALDALCEEGLIEQYYRIYCPYCQQYLNQFFRVVNEIPAEIFCEDCDNEITNPLEKTYLVYRMLKQN